MVCVCVWRRSASSGRRWVGGWVGGWCGWVRVRVCGMCVCVCVCVCVHLIMRAGCDFSVLGLTRLALSPSLSVYV